MQKPINDTRSLFQGQRIVGRFIIIGLLALILSLSALPMLAQDTTGGATSDDSIEDVAGGVVDLTETAAENMAEGTVDLLTRLTHQPRSSVVRVLLIVGGIVLLIAGWRIYDFVILLSGVIVGAALGASLVPDTNMVLNLAALLIGGLAGAILSYFVYTIAVLLIGGYVGILLTARLAMLLSLTVTSLALLIGGVIGAVILFLLSSELLMLLSAVVGAQMLSLALGLGAEWTVIFAAAGIIIQLMAARAFNFKLRRRPARRSGFRRA